MNHDFCVMCTGVTVRTFNAYSEVRTLVARLYPEAQYWPWAKNFDGRLWREVRVAGQCVLAIGTRLTEFELARQGAV